MSLDYLARGHQREMTNCLKRNDVFALFVEMGLGKTAAVLEALSYLFCDGKVEGVLVVAPLKVANLTWPDEVEKWNDFSWMKIVSLRTEEGQDAWHREAAHIYTINYESLPKITEKLIVGKRKMPANLVLFDEIDNAKNPGSKRINRFRARTKTRFPMRWGMTGTPASNGKTDLFSQIRLLDQGKRFGVDYSPWLKTYFEPENPFSDHIKWVLREGKEKQLESKIADMSLVMTRKEFSEVPPTFEHEIKLVLPKAVQKVYDDTQKDLISMLDSDIPITVTNQGVLLGKLKQITSGEIYLKPEHEEEDKKNRTTRLLHNLKIEALGKLHKSLGHAPLIVSVQFRHETKRILEAFPEAVEFKEEHLEPFNKGKLPMVVAHPLSISHGLNMQGACRNIAFFTIGTSEGRHSQTIARIARTGQKYETHAHYLNFLGSVDQAAHAAIKYKGNEQSEFLKTLQNVRRLAA